MMTTYSSGSRKVEVTNADRVLFPDEGITKGEIVDYYASVAQVMLPHMKDRAVTMFRAPEGLNGDAFFQQHTPDYFPGWISRVELAHEEAGPVEHLVCNSMPALVYMANHGCITFHTWLSRVNKPDQPDRTVFDLDPSDDDFEKVRSGAFILKELLEEIGLAPFVKTTGSRGVHVVAPVRRESDFDLVRDFCNGVAEQAVAQAPDMLTTAQRKANRGDRVFVDTLRNSYGQTAVAAYAVRMKPGAPVSTPITWDQLEDSDLGPQSFTVQNVIRRIGQTGDPWANMSRRARSLTGPKKKLEQMREG